MYKYLHKHGVLFSYASKFFLIMRLTTIIILGAIMQVSASSYAQRVTLNEKNSFIGTVLDKIRQQSGYGVIADEATLNKAIPVNVSVKNVSIEDALTISFKNQPLTYEIKDNTVIIKIKQTSFLDNILDRLTDIDVHGRVVDEAGKGLSGAIIKIKDGNRMVISNTDGYFTFLNVDENTTLSISYLGFEVQELKVKKEIGDIRMLQTAGQLDSVTVYSTGYQQIKKEIATGAFTQINNKTINRSVGINILNRLEGVANGLLLNRNLQNGANNSTITVRGRSTLFANAQPLIVLDGFPYEGTINQINPADINTIDILKDAAAASIWGTRASNGVVVITTKKGTNNQKLALGLSSTLTIDNKPDAFYVKQISSSDYIDIEKDLFSRGFYDASISQKWASISQAVEIFNKQKNNLISSSEAEAQLLLLRNHDVRLDIDKYINRQKIYQQYNVNISGGDQNNRYYMSGGYDKNLEATIPNRYERLTLNANNTYSLWNNKIEISGDFNYSSSNTITSYDTYVPFSPYDQMVNNAGQPLVTVNNLRLAYIDTAGRGKLLDWNYRPKDELIGNNSSKLDQYKLKFGFNYKIYSDLSMNVNYQFLKEETKLSQNPGLNSFATRNLINSYSSIDRNGNVVRSIPYGEILNQSLSELTSKILRLQLNYKKTFSKLHEINIIAGYEGADNKSSSNTQLFYGYNSETFTNGNNLINPLASYPLYYSPGNQSRFSTAPSLRSIINITQSYFSSVFYSFKNRYILTLSSRKDESNLFGVRSNQRGVPLWSAGFAWILSQENFYNQNWLPELKLRATFGYNGNVDKTISGLLTVSNFGLLNPFGSNYSSIGNPPNPTLRWEKVKTWNLGLDFAIEGRRITGSFDAYQKNGNDLIGNSPIAMQSGISQFKGNNANLVTKGVDLALNTRNLINEIKWTTSFLLNYNTDRVTNYKVKQSSNSSIISSNFSNPLEGYPYYAIFSFPSAGLDATGSPQGYLNGAVSKDYARIRSILDPSQLKFHGSATPKYFGNIINNFSYKNLELSLNIIYKLDYYFRRLNVFSGGVFNYKRSDYELRWQKPGDELTTNIPSFVYPSNGVREAFFNSSSDLVEKADHIRLQDVRLSYQIGTHALSRLPIQSANLFLYAKNFGTIWKATKTDYDPDYGTSSTPQPLSFSIGINLTL